MAERERAGAEKPAKPGWGARASGVSLRRQQSGDSKGNVKAPPSRRKKLKAFEKGIQGGGSFRRHGSRSSLTRRKSERERRHRWTDKLAYFLDRVLAKRWAFFLFLSTIGLILVAGFGMLYSLVVTQDWDNETATSSNRFIEGVWSAWTFMADPGTHADVSTSGQRILGSIISIGGILFFASILGVTVDIVREKMDSLRQGRSRIIESDHTLILGWTEKTFHIVEELCEANASEGGGVIAILAPEQKERMEDDLFIQLPPSRRQGSRVVFRSGSPLVMQDLLRVSVHMARAVVILGSAGEADRADADTLRAMLTLRTPTLRNIQGDLSGHVVAEVRDIDNEPLVKMVGGETVETLVSHDMIGRLMLMSVRQPGLARVYEALLGFEGDEFYMAAWPALTGRTYEDLVGVFPDAVPIGVKSGGRVVLNPDRSYMLQPKDEVIVIAEDNNTYQPQVPDVVNAGDPPPLEVEPKKKEVILFCGWRRDVRDILKQLDRLVEAGSEVHMMTHCVPIHQRNERLLEDGLDVMELQNITLVHYYGNTSVRRKLEALPLERYSSCMIFADQMFEADTMHADSHSLATLLLIRNIQAHRADPSRSQGRGRIRKLSSLKDHTCPIICEILDPHTQKTIAESEHLSLASDFCQSNKLIAQVMTMIAEERTVKVLLNELLGSKGVCIHVVPSSRYCGFGEALSFWALSKRALQFSETIIGYQMRSSTDKTVLNPPDKMEPLVWDKCDIAILQGEMFDGWCDGSDIGNEEPQRAEPAGTGAEDLAERLAGNPLQHPRTNI